MKERITIAKLLVISATILMTVGVCCLPFIKFSQIGKGTHTGFVTAVDQRGYFFRNYDVYFKTDNSSSQEDLYCVHRENTQLIETLKQVSTNKLSVTIEYQGVRDIGLGLCKHTQIHKLEVAKE